MAKRVGVWLDHRKAVIVTITDGVATTRQLDSELEGHVRFAGGGEAHGGEAHRERQFEEHLRRYLDEIIAEVRDSEAIWIMGPGEAKKELEARLIHEGLGAHILGTETIDKMTDGEIAERVRVRYAM